MLKKIILCICLLILFFSLAGCSAASKAEVKLPTVTQPAPQTVAPPGVEKPKAELIKVSDPTIKPGYNNKANEIMGTVTNTNKTDASFYIKVIYYNPDGTLLTTENIRIEGLKAGETKTFDDTVIDTDISKATHKIQVGDFF